MRTLLAVALAVLAATPQQPPVPSLGETLEISISNVDVFVTDRHGNRVHGLTQNDFELFENGKPQAITNFAEYTGSAAPDAGTATVTQRAAGAAPQPVAEAAPPARRTIVIFLELFSMPQRDTFFNALKTFVRQSVRPGDAMLVATWDTKLAIRQNFTDKIADVDRVLDVLNGESAHVQYDAVQGFQQQKEIQGAFENGITKGRAAVALEGNLEAMHAFDQAKRKASAIRSLLTAISGVEGKKILLMAMHDFGNQAGAEYEAQIAPATTEMVRKEIIDSANANGVTVYPFLPEGLTTRGNIDAMRTTRSNRASLDNTLLMNQTRSLDEIATATGGVLAYGASDIAKILPSIRDDLDSYYSLAYRLANGAADRARHVEVRVKNREYTVRTRGSVLVKSDAAKMRDRVIASLYNTVPERLTIPIAVQYGKVTKLRNGNRRVSVQVRVPISALTLLPAASGTTGSVSIFVASGGEAGVASEVAQHTRAINVKPEQLAVAKQSDYGYTFEVELDERATRIGIGVLDDISREYGVGSVPAPAK